MQSPSEEKTKTKHFPTDFIRPALIHMPKPDKTLHERKKMI